MDFTLSEEHKLFQRTVREFVLAELAPKAQEIDRTGEFPAEIIRKMATMGLLGVPFPEEYGGAGGDTLMYAIAVEEISRACGSTGIILAAHVSLGVAPFYLFGSEEQKRKFMPPLARGEKLGAFGLTESQAGSDAGGTRTTARRDGNEWVINGAKIYCTNGSLADTLVLTAVTDKTTNPSHGISSFIVEKGAKGFTYGKNEEKMGLHGSVTSQLFFEDVRVPAENILGKEGEGFKQFLTVLDGGRISIGAMALGIAQGAFDIAVRYAQQREQFGQPIANFQAIQFMLADMATWLEAARLLIYRAAVLKDQHKSFATEASMGKLYASEIGERVCHHAIQILGGNGYVREYEVERMYRDVRLTEIGEGTSEIQRLVIARNVLKANKI